MSLKVAVLRKRARYLRNGHWLTKACHHYERTRAVWKRLSRRKRRRIVARSVEGWRVAYEDYQDATQNPRQFNRWVRLADVLRLLK